MVKDFMTIFFMPKIVKLLEKYKKRDWKSQLEKKKWTMIRAISLQWNLFPNIIVTVFVFLQGKFCEKKSLFLYVKRLFFPGLIDKLIEFESIWRYFLKIFKNILKFSPVAVLAWLLLAGKGYNEAGSLKCFWK